MDKLDLDLTIIYVSGILIPLSYAVDMEMKKMENRDGKTQQQKNKMNNQNMYIFIFNDIKVKIQPNLTL